ncbi:MAG: hypothetical protein WKF45_11435 [Ilumatobacteraceae bacterium]
MTNDQKDPTDMFHRTHSRRFARGITATALAALTLGAAACGEDDAAGPTQPTGPDTTEPPEGGYEHPTDPDEAILVFTRHANDTPGAIPEVVVGGDGKVYQPGEPGGGDSPVGIAPPQAGPSPVMVAQLSPAGVQRLLARADELELLDDAPEYADVSVTDSFSTSLTITTGEGTVEHVAYALGFDSDEGEVDDERQRFEDFAAQLDDFERFAGDDLGDAERYVAETWLVGDWGGYYGVEDSSNPMSWPDDVDVVEGCVELDISKFPSGVSGRYVVDEQGNRDTLFGVAPDLPGDEC